MHMYIWISLDRDVYLKQIAYILYAWMMEDNEWQSQKWKIQKKNDKYF